MIIVVGGSSRKSGKTTIVCEIIAATREAEWTAVKITPHVHEPGRFGDTERYLAAGAKRAVLAGSFNVQQYQGNLIVESTSVMDWLSPDLFVLTDGGGEWKASAVRNAVRAQFLVEGRSSAKLIEHVKALLASPRSG